MSNSEDIVSSGPPSGDSPLCGTKSKAGSPPTRDEIKGRGSPFGRQLQDRKGVPGGQPKDGKSSPGIIMLSETDKDILMWLLQSCEPSSTNGRPRQLPNTAVRRKEPKTAVHQNTVVRPSQSHRGSEKAGMIMLSQSDEDLLMWLLQSCEPSSVRPNAALLPHQYHPSVRSSHLSEYSSPFEYS